jgi:hypothetical protein
MRSEINSASWCPLNNSYPNIGSVTWDEENPPTTFNCMKMKIRSKVSPTPLKVVWSYRKCNGLYTVACKVRKILSYYKADNNHFCMRIGAVYARGCSRVPFNVQVTQKKRVRSFSAIICCLIIVICRIRYLLASIHLSKVCNIIFIWK